MGKKKSYEEEEHKARLVKKNIGFRPAQHVEELSELHD